MSDNCVILQVTRRRRGTISLQITWRGTNRYEPDQSLDDGRVLIFTEKWASERVARRCRGTAMRRFQASGASRLPRLAAGIASGTYCAPIAFAGNETSKAPTGTAVFDMSGDSGTASGTAICRLKGFQSAFRQLPLKLAID